jgi:uncharacterized protein (DUF362 family)
VNSRHANGAPGTTRRQFLRLAGSGLVAVTGGGILAGCGRALEWSADRARGTPTSMQPPTSATPTLPIDTSPTTTTAGSTPPETVPSLPDLAVFRGAGPEANVRAAIAALGGMEHFVSKGARVVLKPNVLTGRAPEYATTTNPTVVGTLASMCYEAGADQVVVLDRPTSSARAAFDVSQIEASANAADAQVKYLTDRNFENIALPEGRVLTSWPLVTDVFEADVFINIPIGKTHGMAGLTLAMKNLMGIMGGSRGLIHLDFTQKIVDLCTLVRPHLVVLDSTRILTRNGPTGGNLDDVRTLDTIVAGTDQVAVDAYGATLFGMQPQDLDYLKTAAERGVGVIDLETLRIAEGPGA